jgi:gallate decarboxylase subunit D
MRKLLLNEGKGRTKVSLSAQWIGKDLIVCLFNKQGHLGAVAVAEFSKEEKRASTSVITRLGHKDDSIAYYAAYNLSKRLRQPVCAIAGIHLDNITEEEIVQISQNCETLVDRFSRRSAVGGRKQKASTWI